MKPRHILCSALILGACNDKPRSIVPEPPPLPSAVAPAAVEIPDAGAVPDAQAPAALAECPPEQRIRQSLDDWRRRLKQAKTAQQRNALLAELGLRAVEDSSDDTGVHSSPTLDEVDIRSAALAGETPDDRLVSVSYSRKVNGIEGMSVRIQALRRTGTNEWCRLSSQAGADPFQVDQLQTENACLGAPELRQPVRVTLVNVVHPRRQTLKVLRQSGRCDGCGRSGEVLVRYYDASGFSLGLLFSHALYATFYSGCPWPPVKETVGSLELEGAYPKQIVATTEIACHLPTDGLPDQYREPCAPEVTTAHHALRGGAYVELARTRSAQPSRSPLHIDDVELNDTQGGMDWGNRCAAHLGAGRDDAARAACERGLAMNPSAGVRGALHYNLALIEERAKDVKAACKELAASLSARPENTQVKAKAEALGCLSK